MLRLGWRSSERIPGGEGVTKGLTYLSYQFLSSLRHLAHQSGRRLSRFFGPGNYYVSEIVASEASCEGASDHRCRTDGSTDPHGNHSCGSGP